MLKHEITWLAGFLEGEGCFRTRGSHAWIISVVTTDKDVAEKVVKLLDGNLYGPYKARSDNHSPVYRIDLLKRDKIKKVLEMILPYMGQRRSNKIQGILKEMKENPERKRGMRKGFNRHTYVPERDYFMELF